MSRTLKVALIVSGVNALVGTIGLPVILDKFGGDGENTVTPLLLTAGLGLVATFAALKIAGV